MDTVQVLNQLLALHAGSLPMYLVSASPHRRHGDEKVSETLRLVIEDQKLMVDKIADFIESVDGTPNRGEFPMEFTGLHDLSIDFLMAQVLQRQRADITTIQRLSEQLPVGSQEKALAQESLGAAKAHVQALEESLASSTTSQLPTSPAK